MCAGLVLQRGHTIIRFNEMKRGTKFSEWLTVVSVARELPFELEKLSRPFKVGKKETPDDLNDLTIGQLMTLSETRDGGELFFVVCEVVMGMSAEETANSDAVEVVTFVGWVISQVQKINRLFEKTKTTPSDKEVKAGINKLNFGMFGLLDWYAQRMGIADHHEVESVEWLRVYKCLEMDTRRAEYNKRLQEIIANDYRRKH